MVWSPRSRPINVNSQMQGHDFGDESRADVEVFSGFVRLFIRLYCFARVLLHQ